MKQKRKRLLFQSRIRLVITIEFNEENTLLFVEVLALHPPISNKRKKRRNSKPSHQHLLHKGGGEQHGEGGGQHQGEGEGAQQQCEYVVQWRGGREGE